MFLGDAGSKLLGFVVVCLLLSAASGRVGGQSRRPATALYLVAIPLFDVVFTALRRIIHRDPLLWETALTYIIYC